MAEVLFRKYCKELNPETEICRKNNQPCNHMSCDVFKNLKQSLGGEPWNIAIEVYARFKKPPTHGMPRKQQQRGVVPHGNGRQQQRQSSAIVNPKEQGLTIVRKS